MLTDYEYYLLGCGESGAEAGEAPLSKWRFNLLYGEFLRAVATLKDRSSSGPVTRDSPFILRYTRLNFLDEMVCRGRKIHAAANTPVNASGAAVTEYPKPSEGPPQAPPEGPQASGGGPPNPPPNNPDPTGAGDREPLTPREPVLSGAGARPLPRGDMQVDQSWWRT